MAVIMPRYNYSVYFNIFFISILYNIIYPFAATSKCKICAKDWYWKKYFCNLPLLFGKVGSYPWAGCEFSFSILWHTIFNDLNYSPPVAQQNCKWHSKTQINYFPIVSSAWPEIYMALSDLKSRFLDLKSCWRDGYCISALSKIEERSECLCLK